MRIAVNTRLLLAGRLDGIGHFTAETLRRIVIAHPEHNFFFLFDRKPDSQFLFAPNVHPLVLLPQARHPVLWYMFFEWSVTRTLRKYKIDLFLSTDGWLSLRTAVPTLTVIHDINFEHDPDYLRPSHQRYMKHFFPRFATKAERVATVSEFSKKDIMETYHIDADKIDVVYNGSNSFYKPHSEEENKSTRDIYCDGKRFFLFVGTIQKRKNLANTLLAFENYRTSHPSGGEKMLVVGGRYKWDDEMTQALDSMRFKDDVIFMGHVDSDALSLLMSASIALVYVSFFEGFGIPIIEAFQAETAVITSTLTSMPEVAGDAAMLANPYSVDDIASCMATLATDEETRNRYIALGRQRRTIFSWDRSASLLWDSLMRVKNAES